MLKRISRISPSTFRTSRIVTFRGISSANAANEKPASETKTEDWGPDSLFKEMLDNASSVRKDMWKSKSNINEMFMELGKAKKEVRKEWIDAAKIKWKRAFKPGDYYEPVDLKDVNVGVWDFDDQKGRFDFFKKNNIDVSKEYKNVELLSQYVNEIGQVLPRHLTGVERDTQLKLTRVINRAVAFGIIPKIRKHHKLLNGVKKAKF